MLGQRRTRDLVEVRTYMEGVSARLAAQRASDADVAGLEEHLRHLRDAGGDATAFIDVDIAERVSDIEGTVSGTLCEHDAVLRAIRARDPEAADRATAEHVRMAGARLRASVDGAGDGEV